MGSTLIEEGMLLYWWA